MGDGPDFEAELRGAVEGVAGRPMRLTVPPEWEGIPGTSFGGFVSAAMLVAAGAASEHPRPLSLYARYHRPVPVGAAVDLDVEVERRGRTLDVVLARLHSGSRLLATFSIAFGRHNDIPLASQTVPGIAEVSSRPVWELVEEAGRPAPTMLRRVGFRTADVPPEDAAAGWALRTEWPVTPTEDPVVAAATSLMPIEQFVSPAAYRANGLDLAQGQPYFTPSLDLAAWFHAAEPVHRDGWLSVRTAVPVTSAGYALGRSEVWAGDRLVAEGSSQVVFVPTE